MGVLAGTGVRRKQSHACTAAATILHLAHCEEVTAVASYPALQTIATGIFLPSTPHSSCPFPHWSQPGVWGMC